MTQKEVCVRWENFWPLFLKINKFRIKVIAYRPMGVREIYSHYEVPSREYLEYLAGILREQGFEDIIII